MDTLTAFDHPLRSKQIRLHQTHSWASCLYDLRAEHLKDSVTMNVRAVAGEHLERHGAFLAIWYGKTIPKSTDEFIGMTPLNAQACDNKEQNLSISLFKGVLDLATQSLSAGLFVKKGDIHSIAASCSSLSWQERMTSEKIRNSLSQLEVIDSLCPLEKKLIVFYTLPPWYHACTRRDKIFLIKGKTPWEHGETVGVFSITAFGNEGQIAINLEPLMLEPGHYLLQYHMGSMEPASSAQLDSPILTATAFELFLE